MLVSDEMHCPYCNNKVSYFHIRKKVLCRSCGKYVYFHDLSTRLTAWFLVWILIITPASLLMFEFPKGFLVDAVLAVLLLMIFTQYGVELKKQPDEDIE